MTPPIPAAEGGKECAWTADGDGLYETECGDAFQFNDGGPAENRAKFCQYCGLPIKVVDPHAD